MKIKIFILLFLIISVLICYNYYNTTNNKDIQIKNDLSKYIDYPLIEFYFIDGNSWSLVIQNLSDDKGFSFIDDPNVLESLKTDIIVNTFPAGKGISADGYLFLYKNKKIIKTIPYFIINCVSGNVNIDKLNKYCREDVESKLGIQIDIKSY